MKTPLIINIVLALVGVAVGFVVAIALSKYKQLREALSKQAEKGNDSDKNKPVPKTATGDDGEPSTTKESFGFGLSYSGIAALTAILIPLGLWFGLRTGLNFFGGREEAPVMLTLVVLAGVIGLLAVLMMTA